MPCSTIPKSRESLLLAILVPGLALASCAKPVDRTPCGNGHLDEFEACDDGWKPVQQ